MLRHSLRVRLLLPVLALVLAVVVAATLVLATTEASRVRAEASTAIDRQTSALQSLFSVTRSIMLERVHNAMRLLRKEGDAIGQASVKRAPPSGEAAAFAVPPCSSSTRRVIARPRP